MDNGQKQLGIELSPEIAEGNYSNLAIISHSHSEFILDFAQMLPGREKAHVASRIIMCPEHAKRLMNALIDNISKYEAQFGKISLGATPGEGATFNLADMMPNGGGSRS